MWASFNVFTEFVTKLLLFYALFFFWPRGMWDPSSLTRDKNCTPCVGGEVLSIGPLGKPSLISERRWRNHPFHEVLRIHSKLTEGLFSKFKCKSMWPPQTRPGHLHTHCFPSQQLRFFTCKAARDNIRWRIYIFSLSH